MNNDAPSFHGYRFPPEIISHAAIGVPPNASSVSY
jgi:hypothetical protein